MSRLEFSRATRRDSLKRSGTICEAVGHRLRQLIAYDSATGIFTSKKPFGRHPVGARLGVKTTSGYRTIGCDYAVYPEHWLAWFFVHGVWPDGPLDHVNRVRDDNRIANLQRSSPTENARNKGRMKNNTSGHTGVYWSERHGQWYANIRAPGRKKVHLGYFRTLEAAVAARAEAQTRYGYSATHGAPNAP